MRRAHSVSCLIPLCAAVGERRGYFAVGAISRFSRRMVCTIPASGGADAAGLGGMWMVLATTAGGCIGPWSDCGAAEYGRTKSTNHAAESSSSTRSLFGSAGREACAFPRKSSAIGPGAGTEHQESGSPACAEGRDRASGADHSEIVSSTGAGTFSWHETAGRDGSADGEGHRLRATQSA